MQNRLHNRVHNHLHNRILFMQQVIETSAAHPFWEGAPESPHLPNIEQSGRHENGHTHTHCLYVQLLDYATITHFIYFL